MICPILRGGEANSGTSDLEGGGRQICESSFFEPLCLFCLNCREKKTDNTTTKLQKVNKNQQKANKNQQKVNKNQQKVNKNQQKVNKKNKKVNKNQKRVNKNQKK